MAGLGGGRVVAEADDKGGVQRAVDATNKLTSSRETKPLTALGALSA